MVLNIRADGTGPTALEQLVAQHRPGFTAGLDLSVAREFAPTMPPPVDGAHAVSEILEADLHAPTPTARARQVRHLGAYCVISVVACCCAVVPLLWHLQAKSQQPATRAPAPTSTPGVWA